MSRFFNKALFTFGVTGILMCIMMSCGVPSFPENKTVPGGNSSVEQNTYGSITINPVNATLSEDYMRGVDASEVKALEEAGVVFYDEDNSQKDVFQILSAHGVNWIRLRIWNDYTKADSSGWGPYGSNNLSRTINMAQRAKKYGMKVLLDFHYSDTWADPGKQICPDMWKDISDIDELTLAVADWTKSILLSMKDAGCIPDMVQLGNENEGGIFTTNSAVSVPLGLTNSAKVLSEASKAVRAVSDKIEIMLHMSAGGDSARLTGFYNNFISKIDCDAVGLSYYPYYSGHKTVTGLAENCEKIKNTYNKKAIVAEISYSYSLDAWCDYTSNAFYTEQEKISAVNLPEYANGASSIPASLQNQAGVVREVIEKTAAKGAAGIFYWGGCYLGVEGKVQSAWENQALFDPNGKALPSLNVMNVRGK